MQVHQLQPIHKHKRDKRVGRGGKKGTYAGRGGKGQTARSGRKMAPIIRELIKRYPKLRGYRRFVPEKNQAVVNLDALEKFASGETVSPHELVKKGLVRDMRGTVPAVKILGSGKLSKKLAFEGVTFSAAAKEAVEKAGGTIK